MPQFDLPLQELRRYRSSTIPPADLLAFWAETLSRGLSASGVPALGAPGGGAPEPTFTRVHSGLVAVESYDVVFPGFGHDPVRAWLHLPAEPLRRSGALPGIVQYQGYNGGRGLAHEHVFWACAGYAQLVVDTRGQGSGWTTGATPDPSGSGPSQPGFLTRGIEDPREHYYRRVYTDAVRAFELLRTHPLVDADQVAVTGVSQGGGLALAVAALAPGVVAVMPDVPFLCDFPRATRIAMLDPYAEVARYLKAHRDRADQVFATLAYFDVVNLVADVHVPALFSVALMDQTCPPSTVFAAFNAYRGPKELVVYEFNDHEGGDAHQRTRQLAWLGERVARDRSRPSRTG